MWAPALALVWAPGPNWPDLRRDCDSVKKYLFGHTASRPNWPDLRRDCDFCQMLVICQTLRTSELTWFTKGLRPGWPSINITITHLLSELTWFTKGLRRYSPNCLCVGARWSELTWFTKGLRLYYISTIYYIHVKRPNWPDLRRDCDLTVTRSCHKITNFVRIDLIYEGIATFILLLWC